MSALAQNKGSPAEVLCIYFPSRIKVAVIVPGNYVRYPRKRPSFTRPGGKHAKGTCSDCNASSKHLNVSHGCSCGSEVHAAPRPVPWPPGSEQGNVSSSYCHRTRITARCDS